MDKLKTAFRRFTYRLNSEWLSYQHVVLAGAVILCVIWTCGTISSMSRNWNLEQKVKERQREYAKMQIEVEMLRLERQYYQSEEYKEYSARAKLGKMSEGETMVILPENSEEAKLKHYEAPKTEKATINNFRQWLDFLTS